MTKIIGLDLGTNSIGWAIRNLEFQENQIKNYGVTTFEKGIGIGKSGEFSFAAERTKKRSGRRLIQARKYRLWATLEVIINNGYCPMTIDQLDKWRKYDKITKRQYPHIEVFEQWIRLDFNGDGVPDYTSPYQLRAELSENKLDINQVINRYKVGRAFYHIAQRRGFKSSRKDANANENGEVKEIKSEAKKGSEFEKELQKKFNKSLSDFKTIGSALAYIESNGQRVRLDWIQYTFRKQYKEEITLIFEFQGIGTTSKFYKELVEKERNRFNGAIFYQRQLRSQKGLIGKCTLEPNKSRCQLSHPEFEEFRALSLLNNVQYKVNGEWQRLSSELKESIFQSLFFRKSKANFHFEEIRLQIEKKLNLKLDYKGKTINYSDKTNISACPVSGHLKDIFGINWKEYSFESAVMRETVTNDGQKHQHRVVYDINDIWHILFSFEDEEMVREFASLKLELNEDNQKKFVAAWRSIPDGYAMLSLNAIKKINVFLRLDFIYSEAVLLANMPEVLGYTNWQENKHSLMEGIASLVKRNKYEKRILSIVNSLISHYKSLPFNEQFAYKNFNYTLDRNDLKEIEQSVIESSGEKSWEKEEQDCKERIIADVTNHYTAFFSNPQREYFRLPRISDTIEAYLHQRFPELTPAKLRKLYHPSMIDIYPASNRSDDGKIFLQSPKTGAFKNPMAMRTLHELRKLINYLIKTDQIDEETRVVVETARELNDANKRWAIAAYQRRREAENQEFKIAIHELHNNGYVINPDSSDDIDKMRLWYEQLDDNKPNNKGKTDYAQHKWENDDTKLMTESLATKSVIEKYRLWKEQQCTCMYTGKPISLSDLFDENKVDFEHTIPRSISFDNSLANLTVCYAQYNRQIKRNLIPTQLPNYEKEWMGYSPIKPRIQAWEEKVIQLKNNIEFWKGKSKSASDKTYKNDAIRQQHLWRMELDYWQNKLNRFTMSEVTSGFKNSQLVDTQLISKYAFHYLKTAFNQVDVQKGSVTSDFRKILGIQNMYEKKSRIKHSHHAIDATVLTMIPTAAKRDEILQLFYKIQEEKRAGSQEVEQLKDKLKTKIISLDLPDVELILTSIEEQILINNVSKDQTMTPGKKVVRRRGKIVYLRDKTGEHFLDNDGKPTPKISQGDCIRGQLHKESSFGAIKYPLIDENGKLVSQNGTFEYPKDKEGNERISMVIRVQIKDLKSEKDLEKIIDPAVRNSIKVSIKKRIADGKTFATSISEPLWLLDKRGMEIRKDKNGKDLSPIRHARCYVAAGMGFLTKEKALTIKKQTYFSTKQLVHLQDKEHKKYFYAVNDGNYLCLVYEGENKNKLERKFKFINYFEFAQLNLKESNNLLKEPYFKTIEEKKKSFTLVSIIKVGTKVLLWKEHPDEILALNINELNKRLFVIYKFNNAGADYAYLQNHLEARPDGELELGDTTYDPSIYQPRIKLVANNFNCLIEHKDFEVMPDGVIRFI